MQPSDIIVSDASCLILLQKIKAFEVLNQLFANIITTPQVQSEYGDKLPEWITITQVKDTALMYALNESVDEGEASAIALTIETPRSIILIDDLKGRKLAKRLGLNLMGVLGLLLKAKENHIIGGVKQYTDLIQQTDFRVTRELINYVLEQAGE